MRRSKRLAVGAEKNSVDSKDEKEHTRSSYSRHDRPSFRQELVWSMILIVWFYLLLHHLQREFYSLPSYESYAPELEVNETLRQEWLTAGFQSRRYENSLQDPLILNEEPKGILYFIHVSDLHVSRFAKQGGGLQHLHGFLNETLPKVKPLFVAVTGDLTDAKDRHLLTSQQHHEEWMAYHAALQQYNVHNTSFWFDIRGNHDCFDVPSWQSKVNYFKRYAVQNATREQKAGVAYHFVHETSFGKYALVALDACPTYGPARPFNFFGYWDAADTKHLAKVVSDQYNHTIVLNHYPLATMLMMRSERTRFAALSLDFSLFLCGHLHTLVGGLGDVLHARHPTGFLELEVGDLKQHALFRVLVIDHDLISFGNGKVGQWPLVVVTNPKDARYVTQRHEPLHRLLTSTHIRIMAWSNTTIERVLVFIDNILLGEANGSMESPLWTLKWNPQDYIQGEHMIRVVVRDKENKETSVEQPFILHWNKNTAVPIISSVGRMILSARISVFLKWFFWVMYVLILSALILPKVWTLYLRYQGRYSRWRDQYAAWLAQQHSFVVKQNTLSVRLHEASRWLLLATVFRLTELSRRRSLFYPLLAQGLYMTVGPWFVGTLAPSAPHWAAFYLYGIYVDGQMLPLFDTWLYALFELIYFYLPLILFLSCYATRRDIYGNVDPTMRHIPLHRKWWVRFLAVAAVLYQSMNAVTLWLFYGTAAFLLNPCKTWFTIYAMWALYTFVPHLKI